MSRNLCRVICYYCGHPVKISEPPRPITVYDCGRHFKEFKGMLVAKACCSACLAKYLAWIDLSKCVKNPRPKYHEIIEDLSFRSTFDDEPGPNDLPEFEVEKQWVRVGPYKHD